MNTINTGRKPKVSKDKKVQTEKKNAALPAGILCTAICAAAIIMFSNGSSERIAPVSSPSYMEHGFWESYAEFAAGLFGYR